ncbi:hypothetical protein [Leptospirillum ferrooxidans]|jgi:hypothetical protein|uniref:Uncharacterized protein n=2 Tax=root TaxID=1 RepID=I0IM84_LEPFC|nr:hypothetical protein [Leptospirillum ferrooxidans]MDA8060490.1 hypothetical protein [Nitrospiraceae bacterium]BAM06383.1 hypothetical protein LFE_0668 [Leptospirillum ferrooxidans C2-3]
MADIDEMLNERYDGILEGTNNIPAALILILTMTVVTAELLTFPLFGARPQYPGHPHHWLIMGAPVLKAHLSKTLARPWWDQGYIINSTYVCFFYVWMGLLLKKTEVSKDF